MRYSFGFIGCGNMGGALVRAVAKTVDGKQIALCDHTADKAQALAFDVGATVTDIFDLVKNSRFVVLGMKPQAMQTSVREFCDILPKDSIVITMAAGVSIEKLRAFLGTNAPVIRIMPNTPSQIGAGVILYDCDGVCKADEQAFLQAFSKAGIVDKLDERLIDAAACLSGCGPAFVYAFAQALTKGAVDLGVPKDKAEMYTAHTLKGAAEMLLAYGDAESLKRAVCSPKGTTLAGLASMEENNFSHAVESGVKGAYKRTLEIQK